MVLARYGRARLLMEPLEDRTTPAGLDAALTAALPDLISTGAIADDRINVVMQAETTTAADAARLAASPYAASVRALGFGIYSVTLTPGTDLGTAITYYSHAIGAVSAGPDEIVSVQRTPNDPAYNLLYGLPKIGAPTVWDTFTGNPNFAVGVIDSGIDYTHQDLYLNIRINQAEIPSAVLSQLTDVDGDTIISFRDLNNAINIGAGKITDLNGNGRIDGGDLLRTTAQGGWANGTDNGANGYVDDLVGWDFANNDNNPFDDNNHGTHVAGTIGAIGNNGVGVTGVNWAVSMVGLKFLTASGSGSTSGAVSALDYAVNNGIKVTNNSWGGGGFSSALNAAIGRARTAGHIFVAAAGNSASNNDVTPNYPSNYNFDNVVAVAATDSNDALASFSSYGATTVDLAAPGVGIRSTTPNNTYSTFNGTSMATPHVAGAIALYWGANPSLTYTQVISKLYSSVDTVAALSGKVATGGRLNVAKMFAGTTVAPGPKVTAATFSGATSTQFNNLRVTFDRPVAPASFTSADIVSFTRDGAAIATTYTITAVAGTNNTQFNIGFATQTAGGNYALTFGPNITDTAGNPMNQNSNGTAGETTADRYTATQALSTTVTRTYSTGTISLAINDFQTTVSTINVTDNISISDLNVRVSLTHTYDSDLTITLTSPTGQVVTLFNRRGGSGDNLTNTGFDDEAGTAIASGAAPFNGNFRPDIVSGVQQRLSTFDGRSTQGVWTLRVTDNASLDVGRLTNWSITVTGQLGNGGASVQAFGFRADPAPTAATSTATSTPTAPTAVNAPAPSAPTTSPAANSPAAPPSLSTWLGGDPTASDAPAAPAAPEAVAQGAVLLPGAENTAGPANAVYAPPLYFPPASGEAAEDLFEAFAVD